MTAQNPRPRALIAQISDLHVKPAGVLAYRRVDTAAALARCVKELNRLAPRPDLVVISGDLVDSPSREAYDHLIRLLSPLELRFAAIPGNHDDRDLMRAALTDRYASTRGALHSMREVGDVDAVLIWSTNLPGHGFAAATETQIGIPVLDSAAIGVWAALRRLGVEAHPASSLGRLFA